MIHRSRLYAHDMRIQVYSSNREDPRKWKRQNGMMWSATRETTAPHWCIHMCVFMCIGATRKYQCKSEKSVQKSGRVLIHVIRKNACINRITATATNTSRKTSIKQFTRLYYRATRFSPTFTLIAYDVRSRI